MRRLAEQCDSMKSEDAREVQERKEQVRQLQGEANDLRAKYEPTRPFVGKTIPRTPPPPSVAAASPASPSSMQLPPAQPGAAHTTTHCLVLATTNLRAAADESDADVQMEDEQETGTPTRAPATTNEFAAGRGRAPPARS